MSEPHENTMPVSELRRKVSQYWGEKLAFGRALRDAPEVPERAVLWFLAEASMNWHGEDVMALGKALQRKHGLDAVPPKAELECAAGLWTIIRRGLSAAR